MSYKHSLRNKARLEITHGPETGNWELETGNWQLDARSWKLEAGSRKLEAGSWKLEALIER
jgi:hypothetical protein